MFFLADIDRHFSAGPVTKESVPTLSKIVHAVVTFAAPWISYRNGLQIPYVRRLGGRFGVWREKELICLLRAYFFSRIQRVLAPFGTRVLGPFPCSAGERGTRR